jgi:hypothetical protein
MFIKAPRVGVRQNGYPAFAVRLHPADGLVKQDPPRTAADGVGFDKQQIKRSALAAGINLADAQYLSVAVFSNKAAPRLYEMRLHPQIGCAGGYKVGVIAPMGFGYQAKCRQGLAFVQTGVANTQEV